MTTYTDCPKCGSSHAYYEASTYDLTLRCRCGYLKVVETRLETLTVQHNDSGADVKLPRKATNLWATMMVLHGIKEATSAGITTRLKQLNYPFTVSDVASYLTILRSKGLVTATSIRRGVVGGSTWELTDACRNLLGA
jgi:hypothetical protein